MKSISLGFCLAGVCMCAFFIMGCKQQKVVTPAIEEVQISGLKPPGQPLTNSRLRMSSGGEVTAETSSLAGGYGGSVIQKGTWRIENGVINVVIGDLDFLPDSQEVVQAGSGQPATRSESKSEGDDKPQPESEGRSR